MADTEAHWYVAHTYSGYENKVKMDIEKTIENRNLQDQILEVSVPMLNITKGTDGDEKTVQQKMFPNKKPVKYAENHFPREESLDMLDNL